MAAFELCHKFTDADKNPVEYANVYQREQTNGPQRTVFAPAHGCLGLMRRLSRVIDADAFLLYLLRVSRCGNPPGRYQSPSPLDPDARDDFLDEFGQFLDGDARHQLWIGTPDNSSLLVWDHHQLVYAYGPLEVFERAAEVCGLRTGHVEVPVPHAHLYHAPFDGTEDAILDRFEWIYTPLTEQDS